MPRSDPTAEALEQDALFEATYAELRRLAASFLRSERPTHTLQPTSLVNEAYLRLRRAANVEIADRSHFVGVAVRAMRQILIDHARRHRAIKRSGQTVTLHEGLLGDHAPDIDLIALDQALHRLGDLDARRAQIVELRFFGGLECEEVADQLGISTRTVVRQWRSSRAFLLRELADPSQDREIPVG